jgi:YfiH family protein
MTATTLSTLPPGHGQFLELAFPDAPDAADEPRAFLSLASMGDMRATPSGESPAATGFRYRLPQSTRLARLSLVHSRIVIFGDRLPEPSTEADGFLTRSRNLAPLVTVADCMPIWLLDRESGWFGVLHSGWKGTGILRNAVKGIQARSGSRPASMSAILGPCIGSCCYPVPRERAEQFASEFGQDCVMDSPEGPRLDLRKANLAIATSLGLGSVLSVNICTSCDTRLGSYRRQGSESFTRMAAVCFHPQLGACRTYERATEKRA